LLAKDGLVGAHPENPFEIVETTAWRGLDGRQSGSFAPAVRKDGAELLLGGGVVAVVGVEARTLLRGKGCGTLKG
jgi:hypothetical protein